MAGSGVLWKMIFGFLGFSTESDADHDVSPLSELAVQVYNPVSSVFKSEMVNSHSFYSFSLIFVTYRVLILVLLKNVFSIIRLVLAILLFHYSIKISKIHVGTQGRIYEENFGATSAMVGKI